MAGSIASTPGSTPTTRIRGSTARLVGAQPGEVATLNTLTVNLHLLLATFFRPCRRADRDPDRRPDVPVGSLRGRVAACGCTASTRRATSSWSGRATGEALLRTEDLEAAIHEHRDRLAVALLAGRQLRDGPGARHRPADGGRSTPPAASPCGTSPTRPGNVPLALHDGDVDVAAWCTYKYLNGGPGAVGQLFVHERHATRCREPAAGRLVGQRPRHPVRDGRDVRSGGGADGWRISTPPILSLAPVGASLAIFDEVGMTALRAKSIAADGLPREPHRRARAGRRDPDAARPGGRAAPSCSLRLPDAPRRAGGARGGRRRRRLPRAGHHPPRADPARTTPSTTCGARRGPWRTALADVGAAERGPLSPGAGWGGPPCRRPR